MKTLLNQVNAGQLIAGLLIVIAVITMVMLLLKWMRQIQATEANVEEVKARLHPDPSVQAMLAKGYVFCFYWTLRDIHRLGREIGVYLLDGECVQIASRIKANFNAEAGITNDVIRQAIRKYLYPDEQTGQWFRENFNDRIDG